VKKFRFSRGHRDWQSLSRKENCWDNACTENFFGHFKSETLHLRAKNSIQNLQDVIDMTKAYMDYYVNDRPQSELDGLPPSLYKTLQYCV
jgi:transposase InsO family protein